MSTSGRKEAGLGTYFTQNGNIWSADSAETIAHAVIEYPSGVVIEGAHNGRNFNGQCEEFQENGILGSIWMNDAEGKMDKKSTIDLIGLASNNPTGTVSLSNNLSVSPAASQFLKSIAARR